MRKMKFFQNLIVCIVSVAVIFNMLPAVCMNNSVVQASETQNTTLSNPVIDEEGVVSWDCIYFGSYYQSDATGTTKEPIKWRVLSVEGNDAFLLADKNLTAREYNTNYTSITWERSTLRSWLNGYGSESNTAKKDYSSDNFIDEAFTETEQNAILTTTVINEDNPKYGAEGGKDTEDKLYLLSIGEASNTAYGFNNEYETLDKARQVKNTAYATAQKALTSTEEGYEGNGIYWLRSSGYVDIFAANIEHTGELDEAGGSVDYSAQGVRPVLHLNLAATDSEGNAVWTDAGEIDSNGVVTEPETPADPTIKHELINPTVDAEGVVSWDCVYFGSYYQNDTTGTTKEPIKWRVLSVEGNNAFLLADKNLAVREYNTNYTSITWERSTLRSWLNGYGSESNTAKKDYSSDNFIDEAFTETEQKAILTTTVINEDNPKYGAEGGKDTEDKLYLLSIGEASNTAYGFSNEYETPDKTGEEYCICHSSKSLHINRRRL